MVGRTDQEINWQKTEEFKDFSWLLSDFLLLFKADLIFNDFSRKHSKFKYFSSLSEPCIRPDLDWKCLTLWWYSRKNFSKKLFQKQQMTKKHEKLPSMLLTLKAPMATKVVCFSCLLKCLRSLYGKQCELSSDCSYSSGSTLFASILNSSVMLDNYLQQTPSADSIFRCIFFLAL